MHERFTLVQRPLKSGRKVYYVRFRGPDGERLAWRSTGQTSKAAARRWAEEYLKRGLLPGNETITLRQMSARVWDWDSEYLKGQRARGRQIGRSYVAIQKANMENHVLPTLGDKPVAKITRTDIERWQLVKHEEENGLASRTINHCLSALKVVLRHAEDSGVVSNSPAEKVGKLSERPEERGVLTEAEARKVLDPRKWNRPDLWLFNTLAAVTGMRMGELQALRVGAVHRDYIDVREAWERRYGFKEPKWGSQRKVPIGPSTHEALGRWVDTLEDKRREALIFPGSNGGPVSPSVIGRHLQAAMKAAGIGERQREERRLSFHSWRHFATTALRKSGVNDAQVMAITGHKTAAMLDIYGQHFRPDDYADAVKVLERGVVQ